MDLMPVPLPGDIPEGVFWDIGCPSSLGLYLCRINSIEEMFPGGVASNPCLRQSDEIETADRQCFSPSSEAIIVSPDF
jgi:hypothetical protein